MNTNVISIWAPLRYGNYGDDLQAIVFAKYIKSLGYNVRVYQLDKNLAKIYNLETANNLHKLCHNVKVCIIAGGALLTPFLLHKRLLNRSALEYERDFKELNKAVKKYNTQFCAISMGGDGKVRWPFLYYSKHRISFFKSSNFLNGTVRLKGDVNQMKVFGKDFKYFPDCLLQSTKYLNISPRKSIENNKITKIGLNFKKGKYLDKVLINEIYKYADNNNDIEFSFIKTHLENTGINYEYVPIKDMNNIKIVHYESPTQLLEYISDIDILITSKLHLAITGLTVGTPYFSYRGPGKAKSFTKSIGGEWAILNDNISFNELKNNYLNSSKDELFNKFDINILNEMIDESWKQFEFCELVINANI